MNEWAVEHADDDDDAVLAGLLRDAEPLMPGVTNDIEFVRVNRWYPVLVYSHPGLYRELGHFYATRRRGKPDPSCRLLQLVGQRQHRRRRR
ncbi:hypothetical protein [Mycobacterium kiyosense]|nr:hypothetical protein IWGMT90018_00980 [Mycobacterium kiyosense]